MSVDNSPEGTSYTPRRAQKCLFACDDNSYKRNICQDLNDSKDMQTSSGEESDLGPMSPLTLTDQSPSTSNSSPGREFISPFTTPDKSSTLHHIPMSWDRLTSSLNNAEDCMSPFSSLKKVTRAARYSPRYKIFSKSPRSLSFSPNKTMEPWTPESSKIDTMEEIVPETPQRSLITEFQNENITETPQKNRSPEYRLITPLGSITKTTSLPKLHKRKCNTFETYKGSSLEQKENILKRHIQDQLTTIPVKLFKTDDTSVPKARAALFQENKNKFNLQNFSLSSKTFYSSYEKIERPFAFDKFKSSDIKKRRNLSASNSYRRSSNRQRSGRINAGVFHGIKKPKPKVNPEVLKKEGQHITQDPAILKKNPEQDQLEGANVIIEVPSSKINKNKRFFKTNKTKLNQTATITVNNKIKLKVADGKIVLNKKRITSKNSHMQAKARDISFDVTDLIVDEPDVEATLEQSKVAKILKILEDDWGNDDYDTMGALTDCTNTISPLKSTMLVKDVIMSPASELSNMTSTMNIKDIDQHIASPISSKNISFNKTENNTDNTKVEHESEIKYFPLFTKGYSMSDNIFKENTIKSTKIVKKMQWQLSIKGGGGEDQYQLDVGQKHFGATQCPECNVVYQLGDPDDENAHLNYHNSVRTLKFQGWKRERVMMEDPFTSSRIILIEPHDPKQYWKKVSEILTVVDRDLGLADMKLSEYQGKKIFLYIRERNVLGVLVAEYIKTAYRMIPELIELDCCTAESTPTKCGINVVWTAMSHRKQGIATKLIDTLRAKLFYGYMMSLDDIAFSIPTPSGKIFAEKYTKTRNFKVYN